MPDSSLSPKALLDLYFLDARSKLIDIAAFLDRVERASESAHQIGNGKEEDFRLTAFKEALQILQEENTQKAKTVQMIFSDPTTAALESAAGMKGATGAYRRKTTTDPKR